MWKRLEIKSGLGQKKRLNSRQWKPNDKKAIYAGVEKGRPIKSPSEEFDAKKSEMLLLYASEVFRPRGLYLKIPKRSGSHLSMPSCQEPGEIHSRRRGTPAK